MKNILTALTFAVLLCSCGPQSEVKEMSREEIKLLVSDAETTLVDVRVPEEFAVKSVPGAVNIPLSTIEKNLDFFRKQKHTVVFCNTGRQSREAIEILNDNGIHNVYSAVSVENVNAIKQETK